MTETVTEDLAGLIKNPLTGRTSRGGGGGWSSAWKGMGGLSITYSREGIDPRHQKENRGCHGHVL